jgi:hypothetical protein
VTAGEARRIRLRFIASAVSATATLIDDAAPATCDALWEALPVTAVSHHAVYSGSEAVLVLPALVRADPENATSDVVKGDVGFTWFDAGSSFGVDEAFSEICWFYDDDARPSMHEGPVPVSLFARLDPGSEAFCDESRRMRREGVKGMTVERVGGHDADVALVWCDPHCGAADAAFVEAGPGRIGLSFTEEAGGAGPRARSRRRLVVESDDGVSWSAPRPVDPSVGAARLALPDGRVLDAFTADDGTPHALPRLFVRIDRAPQRG